MVGSAGHGLNEVLQSLSDLGMLGHLCCHDKARPDWPQSLAWLQCLLPSASMLMALSWLQMKQQGEP